MNARTGISTAYRFQFFWVFSVIPSFWYSPVSWVCLKCNFGGLKKSHPAWGDRRHDLTQEDRAGGQECTEIGAFYLSSKLTKIQLNFSRARMCEAPFGARFGREDLPCRIWTLYFSESSWEGHVRIFDQKSKLGWTRTILFAQRAYATFREISRERDISRDSPKSYYGTVTDLSKCAFGAITGIRS